MHFFKAISVIIVLVFAVSVFAQDSQKDLYEKFTKNYNKGPAEQAIAREAVKQYLEKYAAKAKSEDEKKVVAFVTDWAAKFDKATRGYNLFESIKARKADEAFAQSKQVFVDDPEDVEAYYSLAGLGYEASVGGNRKNDAEAMIYSKKAIELLEAGKHFNPAKPLTATERADYIGYANFFLGSLLLTDAPSEAKPYFLKAIGSGDALRTSPSVYISLYNVYNGEYIPLSKSYNSECGSERLAATPTCKDLLAKANVVMDKVIDSVARAVAYADASPNPAVYAQSRTAWIDAIRAYFKSRNNGSDAGLEAYIKGVLAKPLPN